MTLDISTPALLFPAISLLLLAYTNRYLALASVIRDLVARKHDLQKTNVHDQVRTLHQRIHLIRYMQMTGIASLIFCVISMALIWNESEAMANVTFGLSLLSMALSLVLAFIEVLKSGEALALELNQMEKTN